MGQSNIFTMISRTKFDVILLLIILIWLIVAIFITFINDDCYRDVVNSYDTIANGLSSKLVYKKKSYRTIAEKIYQYKAINEYDPNARVNVSILVQKPKSGPPAVSVLTDVCLHRLISSSKDNFNKLLYFVPIFNHPLYCKVINSYNPKSKKFKNFNKKTSVREIIINDILSISYQSIKDVKIPEDIANKIINDINNSVDDEWIYSLLQNANDDKLPK